MTDDEISISERDEDSSKVSLKEKKIGNPCDVTPGLGMFADAGEVAPSVMVSPAPDSQTNQGEGITGSLDHFLFLVA